MAVPGIVQNLYVTQANGEVFLQWDILGSATGYSIQRSLDGVTYTALATPVLNKYTDDAVIVGIQYYYQVAGTNGSGTGIYTVPQSTVPTPTGEMSLGELRLY